MFCTVVLLVLLLNSTWTCVGIFSTHAKLIAQIYDLVPSDSDFSFRLFLARHFSRLFVFQHDLPVFRRLHGLFVFRRAALVHSGVTFLLSLGLEIG